jgi:hypothetical protein
MLYSASDTLLDEAIQPTSTPPGTIYLKQCSALCQLRAPHNAISAAQFPRDAHLATLARSGTVSRRDMARACGLAKSRIDQIRRPSALTRNPESQNRGRRSIHPSADPARVTPPNRFGFLPATTTRHPTAIESGSDGALTLGSIPRRDRDRG